jgi:alanine dehydrogenase
MPKPSEETLLLGRSDVDRLLTLDECITAVEDVFRLQGQGKLSPPGILGVHAPDGGLHVKAGLLPGQKSYIVAKLNTNFPANSKRFGLPTIQGVIVVYDAENGRPLGILDSIDVTIKRTAAASAVAAKCLARPDSSVITICGCGQQSRAQLRAMRSVLNLKHVYAFDLSADIAQRFAADLFELGLKIEVVDKLPDAIRNSHVCVTCTPALKFFIHKDDVAPGTFIAAVGADDAHKQEIDPALLAAAKIVADSLDQCCAIGDTHHAIAAGLMRREDVYAELSEIVAGKKPGRVNDTEIIVFDSTGVAMEDAVAAATVYERARARGMGMHFDFPD